MAGAAVPLGGARSGGNHTVHECPNETTFHEDTADMELLEGHIWRLSEKVADRAKAKHIAGRVVTLKLKKSDHKLLTRRTSLSDPTQIADRIYRTARSLMPHHAEPYRLVGVGLSDLCSGDAADLTGDLLDPGASKRADAERATDAIREKYGEEAIVKGRALR